MVIASDEPTTKLAQRITCLLCARRDACDDYLSTSLDVLERRVAHDEAVAALNHEAASERPVGEKMLLARSAYMTGELLGAC